MSLSEAVAPHLPFLRRYARALTGSQRSGDNYVRACLEALLASPDRIEAGVSPRIAIYKLLHVIWDSTAVEPVEDDAETSEQMVHQRLSSLMSEQRQALLLTALEGFSRAEAAAILDDTEEGVEALVASAYDEIAIGLTTDVLIIEDEPVIALDLQAIVESLGHRVVAVARTKSEALAAAAAHVPGLILADVQLADRSSGLDAVRDIHLSGTIPVIFITAFPEQLLTGARPEPAFLITKPFLSAAVKAAISQALFFYPPATRGALQ